MLIPYKCISWIKDLKSVGIDSGFYYANSIKLSIISVFKNVEIS